MKKSGSILVCIFLLSFANPIWAQLVKYTAFSTNDIIRPLPSSTIWDIEQDHAGRLWLSIIGSGLVMYDGKSFTTFGEEQGYSQLSTVLAVERGFLNDLWVFSYGQVFRVELPQTSFLKVDTLIVLSELESDKNKIPLFSGFTMANGEEAFVVDTLRKQVWVATAQVGLVRYTLTKRGFWQADTINPTQFDPSSSTNSLDIRAIWLRKNQELIISTASGELYSLQPDNVLSGSEQLLYVPSKFYTPYSKKGESWINALYEDRKQQLWASSTNGKVWVFDDSLGRYNQETFQSRTQLIVDVNFGTQEIKEDAYGAIWLGTDNGPLRIQPESGAIFKPQGVDESSNLSLFVDRDQNLWAGTYQGLYKFPPDYDNYQLYDLKELKLPASEILSISPFPGDTNRVFLGTAHGLVLADFRDKQSEWLLVNESDGLSSNSVFDSYKEPNGTLWLATLRGVTAINEKRNEQLWEKQTTKEQKTKLGWLKSIKARSTFLSVKPIQVGNEALVLFPGYNGLGMVYRDRFYTFGNPANKTGMAFNDIISLGGYWLMGAENGGLFRSTLPITEKILNELTQNAPKNVHGFFEINESIFKELDVDSTLKGVAISDLLLANDSLLLAKSDLGLLLFNPRDMLDQQKPLRAQHIINKEQGSQVNSITAIELDQKKEDVILFSNRGIGRFHLRTMRVTDWLNRSTGLHDEFTWRKSGALVLGAKVLSGTGKGLVVSRFTGMIKEKKPQLDWYDVSFNESMNGKNRLEIQLRSLDYTTDQPLSYYYRIWPYSKQWIRSNQYDITYTNLPAYFFKKTYEIQLAGIGQSNEPIPIKSLSISVSPAWYFTWWFMLSFMGAFSFVSVSIYRKKMEKMLREENEAAERKQFETVQRISSGIAHDLKNSIFSLSLLASNIEKRFDNPNFRKDAIETLESSLAHMKDLVMRLQQRQGEWQLDKQGGDLVLAIQDTLKRMQINQYQFVEWNILLPHECKCHFDMLAMQRVIENLVFNALEAIQFKGIITLELQIAEQHVRIGVKDNGIGMDASFIKNKLFKPFISTKQKGIGLGLYTCRELIRAHGGSISVNSDLGKGTQFTIVLPC